MYIHTTFEKLEHVFMYKWTTFMKWAIVIDIYRAVGIFPALMIIPIIFKTSIGKVHVLQF